MGFIGNLFLRPSPPILCSCSLSLTYTVYLTSIVTKEFRTNIFPVLRFRIHTDLNCLQVQTLIWTRKVSFQVNPTYCVLYDKKLGVGKIFNLVSLAKISTLRQLHWEFLRLTCKRFFCVNLICFSQILL